MKCEKKSLPSSNIFATSTSNTSKQIRPRPTLRIVRSPKRPRLSQEKQCEDAPIDLTAPTQQQQEDVELPLASPLLDDPSSQTRQSQESVDLTLE